MASYEEQLCRVREETEPQLDAIAENIEAPYVEDEEDAQIATFKEEEEEVDVSELPLTVVVVKGEDEEDEAPDWSQFHHHGPSADHCGRPAADKLLAPLSLSACMEEPLRGDGSCESDDKHLKSSQKETLHEYSGLLLAGDQSRVYCASCPKIPGKGSSTPATQLRISSTEKMNGCNVVVPLDANRPRYHFFTCS
ncbi:uncharacterized protein LOC133499798 isoform X2 [Syngnathoides biaculeatus]|uniref:uncharacterized protein LOC133499798 isoform X2 n=1 Tax=Syngnathoides biaculeatus TaxID=300417 RepID=UPI002ADD833B|nr:uncharacterized protein LOC133499798 isoform X2 [Syngnathoides biaculeatus]